MTPGESHNEWYQYYCSNICPFKGNGYTFRVDNLICFYDFFFHFLDCWTESSITVDAIMFGWVSYVRIPKYSAVSL